MQLSTPFFASAAEENFWTSQLSHTQSPAISPKLDISKESLKQFTEYLKNNISEGFVSAEQALTARKMITEALEEVFKDPSIVSLLQSEISKHPGGKAHYHGAEITLCSKRTFVYDTCLDPIHQKLKEEIRQREKFLQSIREPLTYVEEATGECVTLYPALQNNSSYFTVKIK